MSKFLTIKIFSPSKFLQQNLFKKKVNEMKINILFITSYNRHNRLGFIQKKIKINQTRLKPEKNTNNFFNV